MPVCTTCEKAGAPCTVIDRLTHRQYPRGHVEQLEAENRALQQKNSKLLRELNRLKQLESEHASDQMQAENSQQDCDIDDRNPFQEFNLESDIRLLSLEGASQRKFVGESSGVHFGKIVQAVLPAMDYKHEQGPSHSRLKLRLERNSTGHSPATDDSTSPRISALPPLELANQLQEAYFTHRWSSLPFLHRLTFLEKHFNPVMSLQENASRVSLFLTYMVFALGAIDMRRQRKEL